jgi:hypothetical protein
MMEGPKKIYRMGQCWCEKPTHEDDKGYVPADLADALATAAEKAVSVADITGGKIGIHVVRDLRAALAAYRGEGGHE